MLLDESQAALSDLLETLHESLDDYQDNLQRLHNPGTAKVFNSTMNERTRIVTALEESAKTVLSLRPRAADTEREDFHHLWSKLKSIVNISPLDFTSLFIICNSSLLKSKSEIDFTLSKTITL